MHQMRILGTATHLPELLSIYLQNTGDASLSVSAGADMSCTDNCQKLDIKLTCL